MMSVRSNVFVWLGIGNTRGPTQDATIGISTRYIDCRTAGSWSRVHIVTPSHSVNGR